jgi:hypothetical protein
MMNDDDDDDDEGLGFITLCDIITWMWAIYYWWLILPPTQGELRRWWKEKLEEKRAYLLSLDVKP